MSPLLLRQECEGHTKAVRTLCALSGGCRVVSGGHDGGVIVWKRGEANASLQSPVFEPESQLTHHVGFVYAVAPSEDADRLSELDDRAQQSLYSGGIDHLIFRVTISGRILMKFIGHTGSVNAVKEVSKSGSLLSGSWDGTARIWRIADGSCQHILSGHSHAVCVEIMPDCETILTGSQDKTIRFWRQGVLERSMPDAHTDIIRAIASISVEGQSGAFATASNDCTAKLWASEGRLLKTFEGHQSFVFDVGQSQHDKRQLITASDDRTVRIWDIETGEAIQKLLHSATVWQICMLDDGDLATACEDSVWRLWTANELLALPEAERLKQINCAQKIHDEAAQREAVEAIDVTSLPDVSQTTSVSGKKIGQTRLFADGGMAVAYCWNGTIWERIGEVIGKSNEKGETAAAAGAGGGASSMGMKRFYAGDQLFCAGMYDYVFDVEIDQKAPGTYQKLPYNVGDNPLVAAEKFCSRENISKANLEQISSFIRANTRAVTGSDYLPATNAPPAAAAQPEIHKSAVEPQPISSSSRHFTDVLVPITFKKIGNVEALLKKVLEFDAQITGDVAMTANEKLYFADAIQLIKDPQWLRKEFRTCQISLIFKKMSNWPRDYMFPVIDLWRILVLHAQSTNLQRHSEEGWHCVMTALRLLTDCTHGEKSDAILPGVPLSLCCVRYLANLFEYPSNRWAILRHRQQVLDCLSGIIRCPDKNVRVGIATILLNFSISLRDAKHDGVGDDRSHILAVLAEVLPVETDSEAYYRCLTALGCLLSQDKSLVALALDLDIREAIPPANQRWTSENSAEERVTECTKEILGFFGK